jgi:hypothetical protein
MEQIKVQNDTNIKQLQGAQDKILSLDFLNEIEIKNQSILDEEMDLPGRRQQMSFGQRTNLSIVTFAQQSYKSEIPEIKNQFASFGGHKSVVVDHSERKEDTDA